MSKKTIKKVINTIKTRRVHAQKKRRWSHSICLWRNAVFFRTKQLFEIKFYFFYSFTKKVHIVINKYNRSWQARLRSPHMHIQINLYIWNTSKLVKIPQPQAPNSNKSIVNPIDYTNKKNNRSLHAQNIRQTPPHRTMVEPYLVCVLAFLLTFYHTKLYSHISEWCICLFVFCFAPLASESMGMQWIALCVLAAIMLQFHSSVHCTNVWWTFFRLLI